MKPTEAAAQVLSERKRLFDDLERIAADPEGFRLMVEIVDAARDGNGSGKAKGSGHKKMLRSSPNGLTKAVLAQCKIINSNITVVKVVERLNAENFTFMSSAPKVAVADVMRRYMDKALRLVTAGEGSNPNVYEWIEGNEYV